ncbi:hypothetical protein D3C80_1246440 [compost metagenome]
MRPQDAPHNDLQSDAPVHQAQQNGCQARTDRMPGLGLILIALLADLRTIMQPPYDRSSCLPPYDKQALYGSPLRAKCRHHNHNGEQRYFAYFQRLLPYSRASNENGSRTRFDQIPPIFLKTLYSYKQASALPWNLHPEL